MLRGSLERIALARLLVGGCAVLFGACALMQQAQAEHNGGGGSPYAMPQPSYKPLLAAPFTPAPPAPVPPFSVTTPVKERPAHTAAASHLWTFHERKRPTRESGLSSLARPRVALGGEDGMELGFERRRALERTNCDCATRHGDREENRDARKVFQCVLGLGRLSAEGLVKRPIQARLRLLSGAS
jgi:hypothetical protein